MVNTAATSQNRPCWNFSGKVIPVVLHLFHLRLLSEAQASFLCNQMGCDRDWVWHSAIILRCCFLFHIVIGTLSVGWTSSHQLLGICLKFYFTTLVPCFSAHPMLSTWHALC